MVTSFCFASEVLELSNVTGECELCGNGLWAGGRDFEIEACCFETNMRGFVADVEECLSIAPSAEVILQDILNAAYQGNRTSIGMNGNKQHTHTHTQSRPTHRNTQARSAYKLREKRCVLLLNMCVCVVIEYVCVCVCVCVYVE